MNLRETPLSYYGSYFGLRLKEEKNKEGSGLFLYSLHGKSKNHMNSMRFIPLIEGKPCLYEYEANFNTLTLTTQKGNISFCFYKDNKLAISIKGKDLSLRVDTQPYYNFEFNYLLKKQDKNYCIINSYKNLTKYSIYPIKGSLELNQSLKIDEKASFNQSNNISLIDLFVEKEEALIIIQEIETHINAIEEDIKSFEEAQEMNQKGFLNFLNKKPSVPNNLEETLDSAMYVLFSSTVKPQGNIKRYALYASNDIFPGVWSWDNCFSALGLLGIDSSLAWDQMAVVFDHQDDLGQIPGSLSDSTIRWNFCKPPIHGLIFSIMMKKISFNQIQLKESFQWVEKQTNFYFKYKDFNEDGICEYHHGNDSGQDNSTAFMNNVVIDSPDLTAYLIKNMEFLIEVASQLGEEEKSFYWSRKKEQVSKKLINYMFIEDLPIIRESLTSKILEGNPLLPYMSLVLGKDLPKKLRDRMLKELRENYITSWGIATESLNSSFYQDDAYWRGSIWAPTTLLLVEAFLDCEERELAVEIARKYCLLVKNNGFAENFNAKTGEGLRDKSFTWTASVFIYLASFLNEQL